jgi:phosphoglycerol transferase
MNKKSHAIFSCVALGLTVLLTACSDEKAASSEKAAVVDQLAPRYESTLAEGIDFKKPGYPSFLIEVAGVSGREDWGRWTDGNLGPAAKFRFNKPLPKKFVLELQANAIGGNVGQPIKIRVGNLEKTIVVKNLPDQTIYQVNFDEVASTDTMEIIPPSPFLPKDADQKITDTRKLGVGLIALKIKTSD